MRHLEREIERLNRRVLALAAVVEDSVEKSVRSVLNRDAVLAERVIRSDREVDLAEVEVEEECLKILALHQPVADDLRFIVAVLKVNNDLERIADLAVNLAEQVEVLSRHRPVSPPADIERMAKIARSMLSRCLDALVRQDSQAARAVCADDDQVDDMHRDMYVKVESALHASPQDAAALLHYLSVSRYLERIADHATNIAEDVIYVIEGEIVRHNIG